MLVEFGVSKLSVAFVDVPSLVHNNSTGNFVRGFYNYVLSLFKLIYGLSFCNSKVILSRFCLVVVMSSLTASKKVVRALSLSLGGVPSTLVMERSVVFVGCAIIAVFVKKVLG